jgi:hypothetical protein
MPIWHESSCRFPIAFGKRRPLTSTVATRPTGSPGGYHGACGCRRHRRDVHRPGRLRQRNQHGPLHQKSDRLRQFRGRHPRLLQEGGYGAPRCRAGQPRYDPGHQLPDPTPGCQDRTGDLRRLPRRAGDRPRQPPAPSRPVLPARRTADPARPAVRGARAHGGRWQRHRAVGRSRAGAPARPVEAGRRRIDCGVLPQLLRQPGARGARGRADQTASAGRVRHPQRRPVARVVRVRAYLHCRRQRLHRPAGDGLHRPAGTRPDG